jgi:restriction endonuclease Mrr
MGKKMAQRLSEVDLALVSSGDPRWWNAVCWERSNCVKEGLMRRDTERGTWAVSDKGREWLQLNHKP